MEVLDMLQNYIKIVVGNNYYKLSRTANYAEKSLRAEFTLHKIMNAKKNSSKICGDQDVSLFVVPQDLSHIAQYSSLVMSDLYADEYFNEEIVLSFNNIVMQTFPDEFECECFEKLSDLKGENITSLLSKVEPMDVDEWNAYMNLINKFAKNPISLTKISKRPMLLSEVGGIFDKDDNFVLINSEQVGNYELAFILGYYIPDFPTKFLSKKDVKDIHLRTYFEEKVGV